MKKVVSTEKAPKPTGPYSQAVKADKLLFISGQLPINPKEGKITTNTIKEQTIQVMENIKEILRTAGYGFGDVVQCNVYVSSMKLFAEFNAVYSNYFTQNFPARVTVGIELFPSALVEISMIAYKE